MKISGSLEDVGIAEVMQVIHFGARTGRLTVASLDRRAEISFLKGGVVQAWAQGAERLGDLLLRDGAILERDLDEALEAQREVLPARALGRVLLDRGTVTAGVLNQALGRQILGAVREVARWRQGSFSFEVAGSVSGDVLSRPVQDVVPGLRFEVPALLAQLALRATEHDDTKPMARPAALGVAAAGNVRVGPWSREALVQEFNPAPEIAASSGGGLAMVEVGGRLLASAVPALPQEEPAPWPEVRVLSGDRGLFSALAAALDEEPVTVRWGARGQDEGDTPALVVLDARGQGPEDLLSIVQRSRPAPVVAVVAGSEDTVRAYEAGAVAVVPPELEAMVACVRRFARTPKPRPEPTGGSGERVVVERLRRFLDEVRSGLYSATVSLSLMNMVAESAERGILFLAREDELAVLGAFGAQWPAGSPLSTLLRDFHLNPADAAELRRQTVDGARRVTVDVLPEALLRKIGPPRSGEAALVPVTGQDSLVALVYADNGTLDVRLRDLDLIEVATAQIGLAFENELLRRRLRDRER
jgi:hypothetical protein